MSLKSSPSSYGQVAIAMHWVSAIGIAGAFASGFLTTGTADPDAKVSLIRLHVGMGSAVVFLTILRLLWWWLADTRPETVGGTRRWQQTAAHLVHQLFYVITLALGASGIGMLVISGAIPVLFGGSSMPLPDFSAYAPRLLHGAAGRLLLALLAAHIAAALYHHFVKHDRLLARMGVGA